MEKIRVCVRKRPLGVREVRRGEVNVITVEDKETLLVHEKKEAVDLTQYILQVRSFPYCVSTQYYQVYQFSALCLNDCSKIQFLVQVLIFQCLFIWRQDLTSARTQRDPAASTSQMLGLVACATVRSS